MILKVVNVSAQPQPLTVDLPGLRSVGATATGEVISGEPGDVNSIAAPEKVAPRAITVSGVGRSFTHEFPAHSVTVLRVRGR